MDNEKNDIGSYITAKAAVFFCALIFLMLFSLMLPMRPQESEVEKRKLTSFPEFKIESLLSGKYFDGIESWFADTFPLKENVFMKISANVKGLYGFGEKVSGPVETGDEIPTTPYKG